MAALDDDEIAALDRRFEEIVRETIASLPETIAAACRDVIVIIRDFADEETLDAMEIDDPYELLGLYSGVSLDQKSVMDPATEPDMVFLYRDPIFNYANEMGESLEDVIRHVTIHEIGHHFGFSDEAMDILQGEPPTRH